MTSDTYKSIIKHLRLITCKAIDLKNNFSLSDDDIQPILDNEEIVENYLTTDFAYDN